MVTHLEKIEGLERWQAWAGAGVQQFIRVEYRDKHVVTLSRWDVHTILESATEAVFASPGTGGRTTSVRAFGVGQRRGDVEEIAVQRPVSAGEWIQELVALGQSGAATCFQVGSWLVRVSPPDYYAHVIASTDQAQADSYRGGADTYQAMFNASSHCKDRTAVLRGLLQGDAPLGTPPEMARLAVAMCVSEAARNHRTWGINLMLMDLLQANAVAGGFWALIMDEMHPMSKGGTFQQGKVGMKGGRKSRETWAHETGITMLWLTRLSGIKAAMTDGEGRRWRDPVKGEAHSGAARHHLTDVLVARFRKLGWSWE
ncbi:hypothetical protein WMF38_50635 [Sorangium sp. So ce118]